MYILFEQCFLAAIDGVTRANLTSSNLSHVQFAVSVRRVQKLRFCIFY